MYDVITIGSATIDCFVNTGNALFRTLHKKYGDIVMVPFGTKVAVDKIEFYTGGGGTNTAVAFKRLGFRTASIGKYGGEQAKMVIGELCSEGVDTSLIVGAPEVGFSIILDAKGKDRTVITYKASNNTLSFGELCRHCSMKKLKARWFYLASMMGESYSTMKRVAMLAKRNGAKVAFNPSSYIAKDGYRAHRKILDCTDVLVLNREEAAELLGREHPIEETLKMLCDIIAGDIVVVTDGRNGTYCYDSKKYYFIKSKGERPVETTGAGDAFGSTFVAGLMMGKDTRECLRMAQANAESVIMYMGAKNILLTRKELDRVLKRENWRMTVKDI